MKWIIRFNNLFRFIQGAVLLLSGLYLYNNGLILPIEFIQLAAFTAMGMWLIGK